MKVHTKFIQAFGALLIAALLFAALPAGEVKADTLVVGPGETYTSIQAAIDAATGGETIEVAAGTYAEQLVINKSLNLVGSGATITPPATIKQFYLPAPNPDIYPYTPLVMAFGGTEDGAGQISGTGMISLTMSGFTIDGQNQERGTYAHGMLLYNVSGTVSDNVIKNLSTPTSVDGISGIATYGDYSLTIDDNDISGFTFFGIVASGVEDPTSTVTITDNFISAPGAAAPGTYSVGIGMENGAQGLIQGNEIDGNDLTGAKVSFGIEVVSAGVVTIDDNTAYESKYGIYVYPSATPEITNNNFYNNVYGIRVKGCTGAAITGNTVVNNTLVGIYLAETTNTAIESNLIEGNTTGVFLPSGTGTTVKYNKFLNNNPGDVELEYDLQTASAIDASLNYWGDPAGPSTALISGDVVSTPWYATATTTPTTQNVSVERASVIVAYSDTIQGAVDAAIAGDTINVAAGIYQESVYITTDSISLIGAGRDVVTITAPEVDDDGIAIGAQYVTVSGFKIANSTGIDGNGLRLNELSGHCTITNNEMSGNGKYGISILTADNIVTHNIVTGNGVSNSNGAGIVTFKGTTSEGVPYNAKDNVIQFNTITGNHGLGGFGTNSGGPNNISQNWWGSATGPKHNLNPLGTGDKIYPLSLSPINYPYNPWYNTDAMTTKTYLVCSGQPFTTIQSAIDAAANEDTILVCAGTYEEDVVVSGKSFNLIGEVDGNGDPISTLEGSISITGGTGTTIKDIFFQGVDSHLMELTTVENAVIENCIFDGADRFVSGTNMNGINFVGSTGNTNITVQGTTFQNGLYCSIGGSATGLTVIDSTFTNVKSGINHTGGGDLTVTGSTFLTKPVSDGDSYGVRYTTATTKNLTITGSTFSIDDSEGFDPASGDYHVTVYIRGTAEGTFDISGNTINGDMVDTSGTSDLYAILNANTWPQGYGVYTPMIKAAPTKLLMDPATIGTTDTCTGEYEVYVKVQAVEDLVAYALDLIYDSDLITVTDVENVDIEGGAAGPENSFDDGVINFDWYYDIGGGDPPTYDGEQTLIKITFESKGLAGIGAFTVQPTSILVSWPDVFEIPYEITGGASVSFGSIVTNTTAEPDKSYCNLATAVEEANGGDTLRADVDFSIPATVTVDKALVLDLNGKIISYPQTDNSFVLKVDGTSASLTINDSSEPDAGAIRAIDVDNTWAGRGINVLNGGSLIVNGGSIQGEYSSVYVRAGSSMILNGGTIGGSYEDVEYSGIVMLGNDAPESATLDVNGGVIESYDFAISGNGTAGYGGTLIQIDGGVISGDAEALYIPQNGVVNITGGTITGPTAIEIKSGELNVSGGTISGTGDYVETPSLVGGYSTDTGDAIFVNPVSGYIGDIDVNISGGTITSTKSYALREYDEATSDRLKDISVTGGSLSGGVEAVFFTTVDPDVLKLTDGQYNTDPGATPDYVFTPYDTYISGDWFMIDPVDITETTLAGPYTAGVPATVTITVADTDHTGPFEVVFTYPAGTTITYGEFTYVCETVCPVIPVELTYEGPTDLSFDVTLPGAGTYDVGVELNHVAGEEDIRLLDSDSALDVVVSGDFTVTGTFSMQGRTVRGDIPVTLTWGGTLVPYGPSDDTEEAIENNFTLTVNYGGTYTITTLQPRYLNVVTESEKTILVDGDEILPELRLRGGNAVWIDNNIIDVNDASLVGFHYGDEFVEQNLTINHPDCNFDGIVNIQDLALVGGNFDLQSYDPSSVDYTFAYGAWLP